MATRLVLLLLLFSAIVTTQSADEERKVYIVYMGNIAETNQPHSSHHLNMLQQVVDRSFSNQSLLRSYTRSFNGFAAYLSPQEHEKMADHEDVVSIFPSTTHQLQTTRSWDFMGFSENVHRNPTTESDIIIGVIDTGVWPESQSFNDTGFGPVPNKWKGVCEGGPNFTCNKKLIGARYYTAAGFDSESARDTVGHGTHTASTAAGSRVEDASFYGIARGTARGGAPLARIAAYRACHEGGCLDVDILAAFDDAIADGVDIINLSVATSAAAEETRYDIFSIGSLHAMQRGILTVHSAGNQGFKPQTITSVAPWVLTVGASTTDLETVTKVVLGNGETIYGKSVNSFATNGIEFPLVRGKDVSSKHEGATERVCNRGYYLNRTLVTGKIVLCDNYFDGLEEADNAGASGIIAKSPEGKNDVSFVVPLPASALVNDDMKLVEHYIRSTKDAKAIILTSVRTKGVYAPVVASFSSRGPNPIFRDILKPDITAPGVEILAAFSPEASPSNQTSFDKRSVKYNVMSGTSMAAPHVAGVAAYVKSAHPDWSPSAIKSALMTTAWRMEPEKHRDAEFSYGAGHLNPVDAVNPGLVYETNNDDYIRVLCTDGYSSDVIEKLFQNTTIDCSEFKPLEVKDLNYPSMTKEVEKGGAPLPASFLRTVTNVGFANSSYKAKTSESPDYDITVRPDTLIFGALNEKISFRVIIRVKPRVTHMVSASLEWSDGVHKVRSPIVVYTNHGMSRAPSIIYFALVCLSMFLLLENHLLA